jgi:phosphohistidine phosphatase
MEMFVFLVHHGAAVGPEVDPRRPLAPDGRTASERVAAAAAARGARPAVVWHSGKLRAKQTAEIFRSACNPFAEISATKDLQPDDSPRWIRDRLRGESRDILIAGHYPHLPGLLAEMLGVPDGASFPPHGIVAMSSSDAGETWKELWRISADGG